MNTVPDWKMTEQEKLLARLQTVRQNLEALTAEPEDFRMEEETAEEARARMSPEEAQADRAYCAKLTRQETLLDNLLTGSGPIVVQTRVNGGLERFCEGLVAEQEQEQSREEWHEELWSQYQRDSI